MAAPSQFHAARCHILLPFGLLLFFGSLVMPNTTWTDRLAMWATPNRGNLLVGSQLRPTTSPSVNSELLGHRSSLLKRRQVSAEHSTKRPNTAAAAVSFNPMDVDVVGWPLMSMATLAGAALVCAMKKPRTPAADHLVATEGIHVAKDGPSSEEVSRRALCIGLLPATLAITPAFAEQAPAASGTLSAVGKSGRWSFSYPADWEQTRKLLKTHYEELEVKSTTTKKCSVGMAMDPVKISNLEEFGDPDFVGQRVVGVERSRDGVLSAALLKATNVPQDGLSYYELEYTVQGTRGEYHYLARVAINGGYLFVLTGKVIESSWQAEQQVVQDILNSFRVR